MRTREAILNLLSAHDLTASEIAKRLSLPKQLVYYHLKVLSNDGIIMIKDVSKENGRFRVKVYGLRHGKSVIVVPDHEKVHDKLQWLEEYYVKHIKALPKNGADTSMIRSEFTLFMYHVMRTCLDLMGVDQERIFKMYGAKIALDIIAPLIGEINLKSGRTEFRKALFLLDNIMDGGLTIIDEGGKTYHLVHFKTFLSSGNYDARVDAFLHSCLEMLSRFFLKGKTVVEKYPSAAVASYSYIIKRVDVKNF